MTITIAFEGCDRCGKTTQLELLNDYFIGKGYKVKCMKFPDRETDTGKIINDVLTNKTQMDKKELHKLFSQNRYEKVNEIKAIQENLTEIKYDYLLIDRYILSGLVYAVSDGIATFDAVRNERMWHLAPNITVYFKSDPQKLLNRGEYGEEAFEKIDFQQRVSQNYDLLLKDEYTYTVYCNNRNNKLLEYVTINSDFDIDTIHKQLSEYLSNC